MFKTDYITYWKNKGSYGQERVNRMLERKAKRKKKKGTPFDCPMCKRTKSYYVGERIDPYHLEMHNEKIYVRMCNECYTGLAGDV